MFFSRLLVEIPGEANLVEAFGHFDVAHFSPRPFPGGALCGSHFHLDCIRHQLLTRLSCHWSLKWFWPFPCLCRVE